MTTDVLGAAQAAEELGRPVRTILHWILTGKLEATKLGTGKTATYVISREEVERAKANRPAGTRDPQPKKAPASS